MQILITGAGGFIGFNLVSRLLADTDYNLVLVESRKMQEIQWRRLRPFLINPRVTLVCDDNPSNAFLAKLRQADTTVGFVHLGATVNTKASEDYDLWRNNVELSMRYIHYFSQYCLVLFASTAAVYSGDQPCSEAATIQVEQLNPYAFSKFQVETWARTMRFNQPVIGLRFFNVYGAHEEHKGNMVSFPTYCWQQLRQTGQIQFYDSTAHFSQTNARDFVHVQDCVDVMFRLLRSQSLAWNLVSSSSALFAPLNVGTGHAVPLLDLVQHVTAAYMLKYPGARADIDVIPMPAEFANGYQPYTCADTFRLGSIYPVSSMQSVVKWVGSLGTLPANV